MQYMYTAVQQYMHVLVLRVEFLNVNLYLEECLLRVQPERPACSRNVTLKIEIREKIFTLCAESTKSSKY